MVSIGLFVFFVFFVFFDNDVAISRGLNCLWAFYWYTIISIKINLIISSIENDTIA